MRELGFEIDHYNETHPDPQPEPVRAFNYRSLTFHRCPIGFEPFTRIEESLRRSNRQFRYQRPQKEEIPL